MQGEIETGDVTCDKWLADNIYDCNLRQQLKKYDTWTKQQWISAAMVQEVRNPEAWIGGCIKRQRVKDNLKQAKDMGYDGAGQPPAARPWVVGQPSNGSASRASSTETNGGLPIGHPGPRGGGAPQPAAGGACAAGGFPSSQGHPPCPDGPPTWVRELVQLATTDKTAFLRGFISKLPEAGQAAFYGNPPQTQIFVAWSVLHVPRAWNDADAVMKQVLIVVEKMKPEPVAELPLADTNKRLTLKPIFHGGGCGTGLMSLVLAFKIVQEKRPDVHLECRGAWSSEVDNVALNIEKLLAEKLQVDLTQVGDLRRWPGLVQDNVHEWKKDDFILASITTTPFLKISGGTAELDKRKSGDDGGLHTYPTNLFHCAFEGDVAACQALGERRCAFFHEFPPRHEAEEKTLSSLYGPPTSLASHYRYGLARRDRNVRMSPRFDRDAPMNFDKLDYSVSVAGEWKWKGNMSGNNVNAFPNAVLNQSLPDLMMKALTGDPLQASEKNTLDNIRMVSEVTGEERFLSREFWLLLLGHDHGLPLAEVFHEVLPCAGNIYPSTGMSAGASNPGAEVCGKSAYCENCASLCKYLTNGMEIKSSTDLLTEWLLAIIASTVDHKEVTTQTLPPHLVHQCGDTCAKRITSRGPLGGS